MKKLSIADKIRFAADWRSVGLGVGLVLSIAVVMFFLLNRGYFQMRAKASEMNAQTDGQIIARTDQEGLMQTARSGNKTTHRITVTYRYTVNGNNYQKDQVLTFSVINAHALQHIRSGTLPLTVLVKYETNDPANSVIWIE